MAIDLERVYAFIVVILIADSYLMVMLIVLKIWLANPAETTTLQVRSSLGLVIPT